MLAILSSQQYSGWVYLEEAIKNITQSDPVISLNTGTSSTCSPESRFQAEPVLHCETHLTSTIPSIAAIIFIQELLNSIANCHHRLTILDFIYFNMFYVLSIFR